MQAGEGAEPTGAGRLDGRPKSLDDRVCLLDRDTGGRVRLALGPHGASLRREERGSGFSLISAWHSSHRCSSSRRSRSSRWPTPSARERSRSRGQPVPGWRIALFSLGIALLVVAVASPIARIGEEELFAFHMAQHLLLGDLAPLCLLAGLTGPLLRPLLALPGVMRLRVLANPLVAFPIWTANLVLWHIPAVYEAAVENGAVHALEHVAFFSAGIVLWLPVLETLPAPEWFGTGAKLGYIVGVRLVATVIGNVFVWSGSVFYDVYGDGETTSGSRRWATRASPGR